MGFGVAYGPEVEDEWHNFVALNIPKDIRQRPINNFCLDFGRFCGVRLPRFKFARWKSKNRRLGRRTRAEFIVRTPLTRLICFWFHRLKRLSLTRVSKVDMKSTISQFISVFFGKDVKWRLRPSFFPFTEPSAEVDLLFVTKDGSEKWIEVGGCGMVDPNVFNAVGIDSEKYTGWAFGFGIERLAMRKYGITDIRRMIEKRY
jgi:phenylalanyl-tRNA synthetase alpha chain